MHSETCGRALALEHNGDVYSCYDFVEPRYLLGMRTMAALLRQNLPPALIMRQYAAADARRPHNAPCLCGGGRKWARCHGRRPHPTRTG
ncbi:SEC-C metal-binding domain-containing protein [Streptomyces sp. NRRL S-646]|uniref:SEC-C metal-binding domain-containing protein n=1 Tax=Streptomyces sp. NRRL S-646 TaxID=1463917 RepID=UPI0004C8CE6D|nr:SEC-C metal-binding domain-containing protein [Streptomyces sp. NRRL S-646]